jgi:hypothetical protein
MFNVSKEAIIKELPPTELLTAIIIVHNQVVDLKKNLSAFIKALAPLDAKIIVIDNNSDDECENYINRHFPTVFYKKNITKTSLQNCLNNNLKTIDTKYLLLCDASISIISLDTQALEKQLNNNHLFCLTFPMLSRLEAKKNREHYGLGLSRENSHVLSIQTNKKSRLVISEMVVINCAFLRQRGGFSEQYNSFIYACLDTVSKALKEKQSVELFNGSASIEKNQQNDTFFSEYLITNQILEDNWLFHFSNAFKLSKKALLILLVFHAIFALQPKRLWALFKVLLFSSWRLPTLSSVKKSPLPHISDYYLDQKKTSLKICLIGEKQSSLLNNLSLDYPVYHYQTFDKILLSKKTLTVIDVTFKAPFSIRFASKLLNWPVLYSPYDIYQAIELKKRT